MIPANEHVCPMCQRIVVPIWRALCGRCYSITPKKFRDDFSYAYRARVVNPTRWMEKLIEGRQWFIGRNLKDEGDGS